MKYCDTDGCLQRVDDNQEFCYYCWRRLEKKKFKNFFGQEMRYIEFPANGPRRIKFLEDEDI